MIVKYVVNVVQQTIFWSVWPYLPISCIVYKSEERLHLAEVSLNGWFPMLQVWIKLVHHLGTNNNIFSILVLLNQLYSDPSPNYESSVKCCN